MASSRLTVIDAMRAIGSLAIVAHHLAFYGPMSDIVAQAVPAIMDGLVQYARLAVHMFFVLGGFFTAAHLAPEGIARHVPWLHNVGRRYLRLVTPYLVAIIFAMGVTACVRPWFDHDSLSRAPDVLQVLAHAALMQDVFGIPALSAGVWYVAIDFQLFVFTVFLSSVVLARIPWLAKRLPYAVLACMGLSLFFVNLRPEYDIYFTYFMGSYGLGMLAWWAVQARDPWALVGSMVLLCLGALWYQFRLPLAVALGTALFLVLAGRHQWLARWPAQSGWVWIGQRSYSIFLIHFGVCVGFNAVWSQAFPDGVYANALGMVLAFFASIGAGHLLYRYVEKPSWRVGTQRAVRMVAAAVPAVLALEWALS